MKIKLDDQLTRLKRIRKPMVGAPKPHSEIGYSKKARQRLTKELVDEQTPTS